MDPAVRLWNLRCEHVLDEHVGCEASDEDDEGLCGGKLLQEEGRYSTQSTIWQMRGDHSIHVIHDVLTATCNRHIEHD